MQAKDAIRNTLDFSDSVLGRYVNDLDDADLFVRPVPGVNHIAWQLGHLISVEHMVVENVKPGSCPPLPDGFDAAHTKETIGIDDPKKFHTRQQYMDLWKAQRAASLKVLDGLTDSELNAPYRNGEWAMVPTVGAAMNLLGTHALMHVGQFVPVRRLRNKPVVI